MRILTIREPWCSLIIHGGINRRTGKQVLKNIENRKWETRWRGVLVVHAGKSKQHLNEDIQWVLDNHNVVVDKDKMVFGALIGSVEMVGCEIDHPSPWYEGQYGFVLKNPIAYPKPIPAVGKLGLYNPDAILAAELAKYEKLRGR